MPSESLQVTIVQVVGSSKELVTLKLGSRRQHRSHETKPTPCPHLLVPTGSYISLPSLRDAFTCQMMSLQAYVTSTKKQ